MAKDLTFRRLQKGDEEGLSQLFWEVFNVRKDSNYWHWKYYQNPVGENFGIVALDKEKIVGTTAFIPAKIKIGSRERLSAQGTDVVVLPEYRAKGTFIKIIRRGIEECVKSGVNVNYAFSIKITYRIGTRFLGFVGICPMFNMAKVLNPTPYLEQKKGKGLLTNVLGSVSKRAIKMANKKKLSIPQGLRLERVTQFDHRIDDFWSKESKNYQIAIVRDSQYLNWRYVKNPMPYEIFSVEQNQSIKGFIVLKCSQEEVKRGRIVDILVESGQEKITNLLLTKAINYFLEQGVDVITCWMLEHSPIFEVLKKKGFIKRETPHDLIIRSSMPNFPNEYFSDKSKWCVTMGDSDYF